MKLEKPKYDAVASWLRAGDPVASESDPRPEEVARWRRRTLTGTPASRRNLWLSLAAAAGLLAVALVLPPREAAPPAPLAEPHFAAAGDSPREARQIRFATADGTQIIWVLDPNLNL